MSFQSDLTEKIAQLSKEISSQVETLKLTCQQPLMESHPLAPSSSNSDDFLLFDSHHHIHDYSDHLYKRQKKRQKLDLSFASSSFSSSCSSSSSSIPLQHPSDISNQNQNQKEHWEKVSQKTQSKQLDVPEYDPLKKPLVVDNKFYLPFQKKYKGLFVSRFQIWTETETETNPLAVNQQHPLLSFPGSEAVCLCENCLLFDQRILKCLGKKKEQISWLPESQIQLVPFLQTGDKKRSSALFCLLGLQVCPFCFFCSLPESKIKTKKKHKKQSYKKRKLLEFQKLQEEEKETEKGIGSNEEKKKEKEKVSSSRPFQCQQCEKEVDFRSMWTFAKKCIEQMIQLKEEISIKLKN